jgi:acetolactate synthase-1/2/3 large subunit
MEEDTAEPARAVLPPRPASVVTPAPGPGAVADAADLLRTVRRPIVLAGRGAVRSGARDELVALAGRLGAVLATTVQAKEYFAGHPDDLGIFGNVAYGASRAVIEESDGVVAFGASLNMWTTGSGRFTAGKRVVHVDVDPVRIGSFTAADVGIVADARLTAAAIGVALDDRGHEPAPGWTAGVRDRMADGGREFADRGGPDTVDVRSAMIRLDAVLPRQRVLVNDIGRFLVGVWPHLRVADPTDLVSMGEFGSVGLAVPAAVGAAIARPEQMVVALAGDGGLMMHLGELSTAVRERLPLLVVVLNDGAYGAEHYKLKDVGVDVRYAMNAWPDLAALAVAIGARGTTVRKLDDIDALAEIADDLDGPFLVDVRLDPDVNLM